MIAKCLFDSVVIMKMTDRTQNTGYERMLLPIMHRSATRGIATSSASLKRLGGSFLLPQKQVTRLRAAPARLRCKLWCKQYFV